MKPTQSILLIGGDRRQRFMADYFERLGFAVHTYAMEDSVQNRAYTTLRQAMEAASDIVLPLPCTKDDRTVFSQPEFSVSLEEIAALLRPDQTIYGGMLSAAATARFSKNRSAVHDYFRREDVTIRNVVPTVQGILRTVMEEFDTTIQGSSVAIFGFGRIGKAAARAFYHLGAKVTVCARNAADRTLAEIYGYGNSDLPSFHTLAQQFDLLINTIPSRVIDETIISRLPAHCLILDVASAPFGTDFAAAHLHGIRAMQCASLPGKTAPKTAGEILAKGILNIMEETHGSFG